MSLRYFATNRDRENLGHNRNRNDRLKLQKGGYHFVNMEAYISHYLSEVESKTMPEHVNVVDSKTTVFDNFLAHPKVGKVVVCVHGFNVHFHDAQTWFGILTDSLRHSAHLRGQVITDPAEQDRHLLVDDEVEDESLIAFIGFSWPSNGNAFSYPSDQSEAIGSATALANLIIRIRELKNSPSVNLICHSMGNFLACHMFKKLLEEYQDHAPAAIKDRIARLDEERIARLDEPIDPSERYFVDRYIMLAADVERRHLTKCVDDVRELRKPDERATYIGPFYGGLEHLVGQIHNFYSRFDGALAISNLEKMPRKAIESSKHLLDKVTFGVFDFLEKNPDLKWEQRLGASQHPMIAPPNMTSHNATELSGREIGHSDYVDSKEIVGEIAKILSAELA